ncbi:MAG TPA: fumarylacetoacetate hydrolase family protein [Verrucomicrobiae bacterium]|nr:fumarylacetoacetate hydrolase family protein [Verrucomicrobiae bacterium]
MKLCRFQPLEVSSGSIGLNAVASHPPERAGIVEGGAVLELRGSLLEELVPTDRTWPLDTVRFLPPSVPTKIVCVGRNYREHASELGNSVPKEPLIFLKPPSSILAPGEPIVLPPSSHRVDFEGELGVVISRRCSRLPPGENVQPYVLGYTCLNDVTARDLQKLDVQFTRAKGFDTFCPFGPVLETELPESGAALETFVNGSRKQSGHTSEMIFSVDVIIRWISQVMTLEPGDVIATGTPSGVGPLSAGDVVEVSIGGIGTLRNPVASSDAG